MAVLTQHAPGTFCWPELGTSDSKAAKKFYGAVFGWTYNDIPMGPDSVYTVVQKNGKDCAALYTLMADQVKMGVPPNWGAYISVTSADATAARAKELGGAVIMEPMDVMTIGRMALLKDPTGGVFSVWQAKTHIGASVLGEPGALCWTELMTGDPGTAKAFYAALIGWSAEDMDMGPSGTYTVFKRADGTSAAGLMKFPPNLVGVPPHWMSYFQSQDIAATLAAVTSHGGKVMVPSTPIPNVGTFAVVADPQGAAFALLQPAAM